MFLLFCPAWTPSRVCIHLAFFMMFQWMNIACRSYFWCYHTSSWVYSFNYLIKLLTHNNQKKKKNPLSEVFLSYCFYSFWTANQKVLVAFPKTHSGMGCVNYSSASSINVVMVVHYLTEPSWMLWHVKYILSKHWE